MTTLIVQCPNAACGRVSHLGIDPLGRIFRCPRCLTKLPSAPVAAADSGWTAVLGAPRPNLDSSNFRPVSVGRWGGGVPATSLTLAARTSDAFESGELLIDVGDFNSEHDQSSYLGLGPDDSSEIVLEPFHSGSRSTSRCSTALKSSISASASARSGLAVSDHADPVLTKAGILGRFRIVELLGEGKHATVYRAYDPVLERDVALKVPRQGVIKSAKGLERFLGEAKALARLRHPQIVSVHEAGCVGDRHYIAMALIEGCSLAQRMAECSFELHRSTEIVAELAEALAYAHSQGVVHRDVKPANVRLDAQGVVYLMDFGIAYRPDSGEIPLPPGVILGTPAYVAPEQAQGGQTDVLPASDQYSLGAVLYELLSGQPPFSGPPSYVIFHAIHHEPTPLHSIAPKVPRALSAICLKALAKRPEDRYASCEDLAKDLRCWLRGDTPSACRRRGWVRSSR
jgi:tRNA A-37 threonylcarbamoyl transferase component Bud32